MSDKAGWEVEGFIDRITHRDESNSERLVLEAISHLRAFSRDCDALRECNARLRTDNEDLVEALGQTVRQYCELVKSGDCGFWNPEAMGFIQRARAALRSATETKGEPT